eukprot:COSAG04_NODE_30042_length_265_cov_0.620482_1_plen_34_part_01
MRGQRPARVDRGQRAEAAEGCLLLALLLAAAFCC